MQYRPARTPDYPPLVESAATDIGGKTVTVHFDVTREQARAILDEIDRKASKIEAKTEKR